MPNLVECTQWANLQHLDLSNTQLTRLPKLPATLRYLNLSHNHHLYVHVDEEVSTELSLLETLACESTSITSNVIKVLTGASITNGKLKTLLIGGRLTEVGGPVTDEFPPSETLEELSLTCMRVGDARVLQILDLYPKLRKLDISATLVTGVVVRRIVEKGITSLNLDETKSVSLDAMDWARGRGVEVEFNNGRRRPGAKRFWDSSFARGFG